MTYHVGRVADNDVRMLSVLGAQCSAVAYWRRASATVVIATPCQHKTSRLFRSRVATHCWQA